MARPETAPIKPAHAKTSHRTSIATLSPPPTAYITTRTVSDGLSLLAHARIAKLTAGSAPPVLGEAWMDRVLHWGVSPSKQLHPIERALSNRQALLPANLGAGQPMPVPGRCIKATGCQGYPFNVRSLAYQQSWQ